MRRLTSVLALVLLTAPAAAQDGSAFAKRTFMLAAGAGASVWTVSVASEANDGAVVLFAPLASALGVYGMGRILGAEGDFRGTMVGAGLGALPGAVLITVGAVRLSGSDCSDGFLCGGDDFALVIFGALLYLGVPPIGALVGFGSVEPVMSRANLGLGVQAPTVGLRLSF
ncbi:MAG: hypothetical protein AAGI91_07340 [Bacteroidota bacterium]